MLNTNEVFTYTFYAEVNQQIQFFAYVKCFSKNTFRPYVQALDTFLLPQKKPQNKRIIIYGESITLAPFVNLFSSYRKNSQLFWKIFPAQPEYQSHFFLSRPAFPKFYVKSLNTNINICIFR